VVNGWLGGFFDSSSNVVDMKSDNCWSLSLESQNDLSNRKYNDVRELFI
jgi:hypothetical protein